MMISFKRIILVTSIAAAVVIAWFFYKKWQSTPGYLELTQATLWGDLQGIEFQHRSLRDLQAPVLLRKAVGNEDYDVLGVRSEDRRYPYVWIILNTNAKENGIFSMPHEADYTLPCGYLRELESREQIDEKVLKALDLHCIEAP
jgi:hypothetical protein